MGNTGGRPFSYSSVHDFQLQTELRNDSWAIFQSKLPGSALAPDTAVRSPCFDSGKKRLCFYHKSVNVAEDLSRGEAWVVLTLT